MRTFNLSFAAFVAGALLTACSPNAGTTQTQPEETKLIEGKDITPGPTQHETLTSDQTARITALQRTFSEVDNTSLEKWIDDFKRDQDPEREIKIWENMAQAYQAYCGNHSLTLQQKQDVMQVLNARSGSSEEETLKHLNLHVLNVSDAKEIMSLCKAKAMPIEVRVAK